MIQKTFLLSLVLLLSGALVAQQDDVQWASNVIDFSSELTSVQYSAMQVTGKPNVLPLGGENPNAWTPNRPGREEFLTVGFTTPMPVSQVIIAETYNPSAVSEVFLISFILLPSSFSVHISLNIWSLFLTIMLLAAETNC